MCEHNIVVLANHTYPLIRTCTGTQVECNRDEGRCQCFFIFLFVCILVYILLTVTCLTTYLLKSYLGFSTLFSFIHLLFKFKSFVAIALCCFNLQLTCTFGCS